MESKSLIEQIRKQGNIDNNKYHIKPALQNIILKFGNMTEFGIKHGEYIAQLVSRLNPQGTQGTQSNVWVPLIFRALQLNGILVDEECCNVNINNQKQKQFNEYALELSKLDGWTDYALNILLNDNNNYGPNDNSFDSSIVNQKSEKYASNQLGHSSSKPLGKHLPKPLEHHKPLEQHQPLHHKDMQLENDPFSKALKTAEDHAVRDATTNTKKNVAIEMIKKNIPIDDTNYKKEYKILYDQEYKKIYDDKFTYYLEREMKAIENHYHQKYLKYKQKYLQLNNFYNRKKK